MNTLIQELLERRVEVRSGSTEGRDSGTLEACDERWIKLRKDSGELLYFPIANVRLVKPLD